MKLRLNIAACLLFVLILFSTNYLSAQPGCVGFKANFEFENDSTQGATIKFTNTSTWTDSNTHYLWYYGDNTQKLIEEESHTFPSNATYSVCLYIYKLNSTDTVCRNTACKTVVVNNTSSIAEQVNNSAISIYPNPINTNFSIATGHVYALNYTLTDITGRVIQTAPFTQQASIDASVFENGIYFITVDNGEKILHHQKLLKQ